jgi:hypothetical protein
MEPPTIPIAVPNGPQASSFKAHDLPKNGNLAEDMLPSFRDSANNYSRTRNPTDENFKVDKDGKC